MKVKYTSVCYVDKNAILCQNVDTNIKKMELQVDYKEDLRIIRTRKLLSSTLLDMMEEESLDKISVIDLCTKALVNRATFYAHFEDKFHLLTFALEELKDEVYSRFSKSVKAKSPNEVLLKLAHMTFDFVKDHKSHVANLLAHNRNEKVILTIKESLTSSVKYQLSKFGNSYPEGVPVLLTSITYAGALVDLCLWYLDNTDKCGEADMKAHIDALFGNFA